MLLPLVRWPQLPVGVQLDLPQEPLLQRMMECDPRQNCPLGMQLLTECSVQFAASDAAAACPRLKPRKGAVLPLAFCALSQEHYAVSEDGALLTNTGQALWRPALCRERVMNSGQSCAEFTVVEEGGDLSETIIGVGRPTLDLSARNAFDTTDFWGMGSETGTLYHNGVGGHPWEGMQYYEEGDVLRLLLDSDADTLTVKKNGTLLGVAATGGLTGDLCWAVASGDGESVRIKAVDPAEF